MRLLPTLLLLVALPLHAWEFQPYEASDAPPLDLADLDGNDVTLAGLRGKVVVVNFWASWCPPCIAEMPSLDRLQAAFPDGSVQVLAVNAGDEQFDIDLFLKDVPVAAPILPDPKLRAQAAWNVTMLPTTFVVDPSGRIRHREIGEREWDDPKTVATLRALLPAATR